MPELPEVETVTNDLKKTVVGATISKFSSTSPQQIFPSLLKVKKAIEGRKIADVRRRAKLIILHLESQKYLGIHLKMTGRLLLRKGSDKPDKFVRAMWNLGEVGELRFCDVRKFGYLRLFKDVGELNERVHQRLGPEPFSKDFSVSYLQQKTKNRAINIKAFIMDQTIISGIGNIYANEGLFLAKINPHRSAKSLTEQEIIRLFFSIKKALSRGIKYRGSSARDENYRDLYGQLGNYQKHFLVYERKNKACPNRCGSVLKYEKISGRGTFWCPVCQI